MSYYDYDSPGGGGRLVSRRVVLAIAAIIAMCVIFLIGYASHGGQHARAATPARTVTAPAPATRTTPGTGTTPPDVSSTPPAAVPPGTMRLNSQNVLVGYSNNKAGAVAAAGNYTAILYLQRNRTHARELAVVSTIATTPADASRMAADFSSEDTELAKLLGVTNLQSTGVIAYGHPQGYQVESSTARAATVDVYVAGGQGVAGSPEDSDSAGQTFYEVDQVQLVWRGGDWRMSDWSHLVENDGPEMATVAAEGYLPFPIGEVIGT